MRYVILLLLFGLSLHGQDCPEEPYEAWTQEALDSFAILYPKCHEITGLFVGLSGLTDFKSLKKIKKIGYILISPTSENDTLIGLDSLKQIGHLRLTNGTFINKGMPILDELNSVELRFGTVDDMKWFPPLVDSIIELYLHCRLKSFDGIESLKFIRRLIFDHGGIPSLTNLPPKLDLGIFRFWSTTPLLVNCVAPPICRHLLKHGWDHSSSYNVCKQKDSLIDSCRALLTSSDDQLMWDHINLEWSNGRISISSPRSLIARLYSLNGAMLSNDIHIQEGDNEIDLDQFRTEIIILQLIGENGSRSFKIPLNIR